MDRLAFLRSTPLSRGLSEEQLEVLAQSARKRVYRGGQIIISEQDEAPGFYVLESGKVKLFKSSIEGKEQILYLFNPGDMFGMCAAFSDSVFPANAMALEESRLLIFSAEVLFEMAHRDPTILINIVFVLSLQLKEMMDLVEALSLKEIPQRLATFLRILDDKRGEQALQLPVSQRELAKMLGTSPETLSRVLRKMSSDGIIALEGRLVHILARESLEDLARG